jgi:hypothetical protein
MNEYNLSSVPHYKNHPQMIPFIGKIGGRLIKYY